MKRKMPITGKRKVTKAFATACAAILVVGSLTGCTGDASDIEVLDGDGTYVENLQLVEQTYFPEMPTGVEQSSIYVQKIDNLPDDFIKGMDISSLLVEEASGVKYYDAEGKEQDLLKILADAGVNCIRVRVWNDPFDSEGHGYGGGNCTAETAAILGARAAAYGISTCVDFHYSDFWADPNKQMSPKAWADMGLSEKKEALYEYTYDSLSAILDAGADVIMVQVGNETNNGMAGIPSFGGITELLNQGSKAIRQISSEYNKDIRVVVHFTQIDNADGTLDIAEKLMKYKVDYDVFGVSYYPYWHGTMSNMQKVLAQIKETYGVDTCVMETAYPYTVSDGDNSGNSIAAGTDDYPVGVQGQATEVRDVMAYSSAAGALGTFYWEGAWIPVRPESGTREALWESEGSGWASKYATEYDPKDAGVYYGGSSWDNQAFFDFDGNVLDSINVFKYVNFGAVGDGLEIIKIDELGLAFAPDSELVMPETYPVHYNDPSCTDELPVTWNEEEISAIDMSESGSYTIHGYIAPSEDFTVAKEIKINTDGSVPVIAQVDVANANLLLNSSFEEEDTSMWVVTPVSGDNPTDFQKKSGDAKTGDVSLHFWSQSDMEFTVEQAFVAEKSGTYGADCYMQGGDFDPDAEIYMYVKVGEDETEYVSSPVKPDGWVNWKHPQISEININAGDKVVVGMYVKCKALAWATIDDFNICLQ